MAAPATAATPTEIRSLFILSPPVTNIICLEPPQLAEGFIRLFMK